MLRELVLAQHRAGQLVRALRVGARERHGHVQVVDARLERGPEDGLVEARIARVQHGVGAHAPDQRLQLSLAGGVHALGAKAARFAERGHDRAHALGRDVGQHDALEGVPALGDGGERGSDPAGSDDENPHEPQSYANLLARVAQRPGTRTPKCRRVPPVCCADRRRLRT